MTPEDFKSWLERYGGAWSARDADAYVDLFSEDAAYAWTPFDPPLKGRQAIRDAMAQTLGGQEEPRFEARVIAITGNQGWAAWRAAFSRAKTGVRVRCEGVLMAQFAEDGRCSQFREWWHSDEKS